VTQISAGDSHNIIPECVDLVGTVRSLRNEVAKLAEERMRAICTNIAAAYGAEAELDYRPSYPITFNHAAETVLAAAVASEVAGADQVDSNVSPVMAGEDFSFMLQARPGAMIFLGNGDSAGLHNPNYDFNDNAIPFGVSYWVRLAETALAQGGFSLELCLWSISSWRIRFGTLCVQPFRGPVAQ